MEEPEHVYQLAIDGVEQSETEPGSTAHPADDWERRLAELTERMTARINEHVYRSLERSLGLSNKPR